MRYQYDACASEREEDIKATILLCLYSLFFITHSSCVYQKQKRKKLWLFPALENGLRWVDVCVEFGVVSSYDVVWKNRVPGLIGAEDVGVRKK
jgi:hypothetical protein